MSDTVKDHRQIVWLGVDRRQEVLMEMLVDAHEACCSEHMNCPWCEGWLGYEEEMHNRECAWLKLAIKSPKMKKRLVKDFYNGEEIKE